MGRIVVTEFVSLDGVMEDPGGAEDFAHGGWTFRFPRSAESGRFKLEEVLGAEAQLLGRRTYEGFAEAWPKMETTTGEFGPRMNSMPKYVVSETLREATWKNSHLLRGGVPGEVAGLRERIAGDILVQGSATLVQGLLAHGLVDVLRLMIFPVVLGSGKRLFGECEPVRGRLTDHRVVSDGAITVAVYEDLEPGLPPAGD